MDKRVRWSILIPSVVTRTVELDKLVSVLDPQVSKYKGDVEVLIYWNNFERSIGKVRQALVEEARGDYVSFIDDDDLVPDYYCEEIYPKLDGVDYIGFRVDFYKHGILQAPVFHSLANDGWFEDDKGFYRRATHLNPIKREIAIRCGYEKEDYANDVPEEKIYADNASQICQTEHFIDRPLYIYYQSADSVFKRTHPEDGEFQKPILPRYFRYHSWSTES